MKGACVADCTRVAVARDLCGMHYQRLRNTGSTELATRTRPTDAELFWAKVNKTETCWLWTAYITSTTGYGFFGYTRNGKHTKTTSHRYAYEATRGPVPDGLELDHLCRVRACCNPAHLEAVTRRENQLRSGSASAVNSRKTHCPRGHPYDEANTYVWAQRALLQRVPRGQPATPAGTTEGSSVTHRMMDRRLERQLWSVGCTCGWRAAYPLRGEFVRAKKAFAGHMEEVATSRAGSLMSQSPRTR